MSALEKARKGGRTQVVAAFDFDGTLTRVDCLRMFYRDVAGVSGYAVAVIRCMPWLIAGWIRGGDVRDRARRAFTRRILAGVPLETAHRSSVAVARKVVARHLRPDVCRRLQWHIDEGHRVVIVSASFGSYVRLVADHLGVEEVIATQWEIGTGRRLTGELVGRNVRGEEKVRRLNDLLEVGANRDLFAYGDSAGDKAMLRFAGNSTLVKRRPLKATPEEDVESPVPVVRVRLARLATAREARWLLAATTAGIVIAALDLLR